MDILISKSEVLPSITPLTLTEEEQKRLFDAFSLVGEDAEESSVAFAEAAQAEVLFRDEQ